MLGANYRYVVSLQLLFFLTHLFLFILKLIMLTVFPRLNCIEFSCAKIMGEIIAVWTIYIVIWLSVKEFALVDSTSSMDV